MHQNINLLLFFLQLGNVERGIWYRAGTAQFSPTKTTPAESVGCSVRPDWDVHGAGLNY